MIKLLTIVGARPQIIKAAALSRAVAKESSIEEKILHTGQHYDGNMSQVFFEELGIPQPDYNLHVGSGSHGVQTARMLEGIETVLQQEHFDGIVLYGDTNSTLAGAVAASKLHVPVFHIEAGLRSYNMTMPEEINRIVCDQLSSLLFAPTETAIENLRQEGFFDNKACFANGKKREIYQSGDVMFDNSMYFSHLARQKSNILEANHLEAEEYVLATIHRDNNTDNPQRLENIFRALISLSEEEHQAIALPLHPRTEKLLKSTLHHDLVNQLNASEYIHLLPPVSFLDMICLEQNASLVMTDSGGVQKEAFFFGRPCVIFRPETEWVEILNHQAGILADADTERIIEGYHQLSKQKIKFPPLFGTGDASTYILQRIEKYLRN